MRRRELGQTQLRGLRHPLPCGGILCGWRLLVRSQPLFLRRRVRRPQDRREQLRRLRPHMHRDEGLQGRTLPVASGQGLPPSRGERHLPSTHGSPIPQTFVQEPQ
jgi:hypothetical protein